ncbi:MAG: hypothetical protein K6U78_17800, partial [Anaerolineae bacterium]|nr:hypothetical protein [Anaerolineae bacterium]
MNTNRHPTPASLKGLGLCVLVAALVAGALPATTAYTQGDSPLPTPPPLAEGDEVRMVVEGIGELTARVGAPVIAPPLPGAR